MARFGFVSSIVAAFSLLFVGSWSCSNTWAQDNLRRDGLQRDLDIAFQAMLRNLADPALSFRYAQLASEAGRVTEAISALERLLRLNPKLHNIRLELALFYHRLGNDELAKGYAQQALASSDVPAEVKPRAEQLLLEIEKGLSRHAWSADLSSGIRYDTNVNGGPASQTVRGGGIDIPIISGQPDDAVGWFVAANGQYSYDLRSISRDRIDVNGSAYVLRYLDRGDFDLDAFAVDSGWWHYLDSVGITSLGLRPFVSYTHVDLERSTYIMLPGAGLSLQATINPTVRADFTVQGRYQFYENSERRPLANDESGPEASIFGSLAWQIVPQALLVAHASVVFDRAEIDHQKNRDVGGGLTLRFLFVNPIAVATDPISLSVSGSYRSIEYEEPDAFVDPNVSRSDGRREFQVSMTVPVYRTLAVFASYRRTDNSSNLSNYEYSNNGVWGGLNWRF